MAKNIDFMGAVFPDVPTIRLPQYEGGLVGFDDTSDGDITASDVAQGKIGYAQGQKIIGTNVPPSGSQTITENGTYDVASIAEAIIDVPVGVSNVVIGTFKGTTTGAAMAVTIPYTGTGYPIALTIYPTGGPYKNGSTFYSAIQRYAINTYFFVKADTGSVPTYSGNSEANWTSLCVVYKNSDTDATNYATGRSMNYYTFRSPASATATAGQADAVRFSSSKNMSVYIASTSYGFMANVEYTYQITYSS